MTRLAQSPLVPVGQTRPGRRLLRHPPRGGGEGTDPDAASSSLHPTRTPPQVGSEPDIMNAFVSSLEEAQSVGVYTEKQALNYIGQKMRAPGKGAPRQQPS